MTRILCIDGPNMGQMVEVSDELIRGRILYVPINTQGEASKLEYRLILVDPDYRISLASVRSPVKAMDNLQDLLTAVKQLTSMQGI